MHWYTLDGAPCYEVEKADQSGMRATTLRDARKLNLVPSVTTVMAVAAKPALDRWKQDQLLQSVLRNPKNENDTDQSWMMRVLFDSTQISKDAANRGTELHNKLEQYFLTSAVDEQDRDFLLPAIQAVHTIPVKKWVAEKSFAHKLGFGGKVDLSSKEGFVLDFKTKSAAQFDKQLAYDEHAMQLAAYRIGLKLPKAKCYNLFISTTTPGLVQLHEWTEEQITRGEAMFKALLSYWKLVNNYSI